MNEAEGAARDGRYAEALEGFLWCFDHGVQADEAFVGVQGSFLIVEILKLPLVYPVALEALLARREERGHRLGNGTASIWDAFDYVAINRNLMQPENTLRMFEQIQHGTKNWGILGWGIREYLLEQRSYRELLEIQNPEEELSRQARSIDTPASDGDKQFKSHLKSKLVRACAPLVEALAALGEHDLARKLADDILHVIRNKIVVQQLIEHAERAGDGVLADYLRTREPKRRNP